MIRKAKHEDLAVILDLAGQLGYQVTDEELTARFQEIEADPDHEVITAMLDGRVVGWAHAARRISLVVDPLADLGGLVVDRNHHRMGIGKALLECVSKWAREHDCRQLYVRSNILRKEAHAFYEHLGYEYKKTSKVFTKTL